MRYEVVKTASTSSHRPANIRLGAVLLCTSYACLSRVVYVKEKKGQAEEGIREKKRRKEIKREPESDNIDEVAWVELLVND